MDVNSVIYLGHSPKLPLIGSSSELVDRSEPHASFWSDCRARHDGDAEPVQEGCTRGGAAGWGTGECYTGYPAMRPFEAYLMEFQDISVDTAV